MTIRHARCTYSLIVAGVKLLDGLSKLEFVVPALAGSELISA